MNLEHKTEVPKDKLIPLMIGAYNRSEPVGMGFVQPYHRELTEAECEKMIEPRGHLAVYMDYVNGRCCKFRVWRDQDTSKLYVDNDMWMDHEVSQLEDLLTSVGLMT